MDHRPRVGVAVESDVPRALQRMYLSPPSMSAAETEAVVAALSSGWVAPLGPEVDGFEADLCALTQRSHAVALSSGTAGLHLGLNALGVGPADEVIVPTLTFAATAFAVTYTGARPVFVDVEADSWNLDPGLFAEVLAERERHGTLPKAIVTVDVFGRTCDYATILGIAGDYGIPVLCDTAEALGATYRDQPAGHFGDAAVFSFNGNKIITTGGGGMLVTDDAEMAERVRRWSTQSRSPAPWYEHEEIGYNYRLSNVLAAIGRAQVARLPDIIARRRWIRDLYAEHLLELRGLELPADPPWGLWNGWLSTVLMDPRSWPDGPRRVREALDARGIEARPVWKPMHAQPVFADAQAHLTGVADRLFATGLCLPSGTDMTDEDVARVASVVRETLLNR